MTGPAPSFAAVAANLYPWDVDGDPAAPGRFAGLGLTGVTLAAAYHAVRAVTPLHPRHRIVTRDAAVYYPQACGANPGCDPAALLGPGGADGIVLSCWDPRDGPGLVARTVAAAPPGARVAASLLAVAGLGGRPAALAAQARAVREAGATELRLYHAGLASPADLTAIRNLCHTLR